MKTVKITTEYLNFKVGKILIVEDCPSNPNVYVYNTSNGAQLYVPKVITTEGTDDEMPSEVLTPESKDSIPLSDTPSQFAPKNKVFTEETIVPTSKNELTEEEDAVLQALTGKSLLKPKEEETVFTPPTGLTIQEKTKLEKKKRLENIRQKLNFTGVQLLQEGQFWLSDLTDGELPKSKIDRIITCHTMMRWVRIKGRWTMVMDPTYPWFNGMQIADIPEIDPHYTWDPNVLEAICFTYLINGKILLSGLPGTGKTSATKQYSAWTDHPYMRFNGKDNIEQSSFLGSLWVPRPGVTEWQDGLLTQGLKQGYIICIDEVFKIPPGVQMAMQSLYEQNGFLMLDDKPGSLYDKMVIPDKYCRLMLTDNVKGTGDNSEMFAATQLQDTSTLDRFDITIEVDYLPPNKETSMLKSVFQSIDIHHIKKLVSFAGMVREGYRKGSISLTLSPRGLMTTLKLMERFKVPVDIALDLAFLNKIAEDSEVQTCTQFKKTVW